LYHSCGNCSKQCKRNVYIEGMAAVSGGELAGVSSNYGDTGTIKNACHDTGTPCQMYNVDAVQAYEERNMQCLSADE
jgi:hypothetical protein